MPFTYSIANGISLGIVSWVWNPSAERPAARDPPGHARAVRPRDAVPRVRRRGVSRLRRRRDGLVAPAFRCSAARVDRVLSPVTPTGLGANDTRDGGASVGGGGGGSRRHPLDTGSSAPSPRRSFGLHCECMTQPGRSSSTTRGASSGHRAPSRGRTRGVRDHSPRPEDAAGGSRTQPPTNEDKQVCVTGSDLVTP